MSRSILSHCHASLCITHMQRACPHGADIQWNDSHGIDPVHAIKFLFLLSLGVPNPNDPSSRIQYQHEDVGAFFLFDH